MKALSELLKAVKPLTVEGSCDVEIAGVEIDSRKVKQGDLFVAMKGTQVDGHRFIGKAIGQAPWRSSARTCRRRRPRA